ncbi:hypothetical protein WR25_15192 isoform A [Diploscapter pachys]|uniref:Carbonic anhydrase n=1 Tax=Diploscapter pachys TaxID=2018661 RepID=A0A2A2K097_9BILA|nr:hypothetical protein WR25_15192 isoform A [Diploscapter pachys]
MAFLSQLSGHLQQLKEKTVTMAEGAPAIGAHLQSLKEGAPKLLESAMNAKNGLLNKVKLDSIGKVLNVTNLGRNQSPIDIVPVITAFGEHLQNAEFRVEYEATGEFRATNDGHSVWLWREGNSSELAISFLPEEQYHLDAINWHFGTEPMNGSEHTIGGVGYAGELHLIHRNTRFPTIDLALKQQNGIIAMAIFLNESHDENPSLKPFIDLLPKITYKNNECRLTSFNVGSLFPPPEKTKEFWMYEGSETVEPFRETVHWIVFRSALPISSMQLEKLREVRASGYDEEQERSMVPLRGTQQANSRTVISSFRSAAGQPDLGLKKQ